MAHSLVVVIMVGASTFALGVALYAWNRRDAPGATAFIGLLCAIGLWSLFSALHVATRDAIWSKLRFIPIASVPVTWLVLTLQVTGHAAWLNTRRLVGLFTIPVITQLMIWVNPYGLMWDRYPFDLNAMGETTQAVSFGPWFWIYVLYSYILFLTGILLLLRQFFRSSTLYRLQVGILLLGITLPLAVNVAFSVGWLAASEIDYTALAFTLAGIPVTWSLFRYRMFDVVPVARDTLIDRMNDGMLVLDVRNRVVDLNPAMHMILEDPARRIVGRSMEDLQALRKLVNQLGGITDRHEVIVERDGEPYYYDLMISPLKDRQGHLTGRLIVMRDVTQIKQAEEFLRRSNVELTAHVEELDAFAHTVAHDLKNPLSSLIGYSQLLEKRGTEMSKENERYALQAISRSGSKMATIIDELLLLASVRKADEITPEPLDMAAVVAEVQERLAYMIEESEAQIVLPEVWPASLGRAAWVEEVWANYVSNAIKYGGTPPRVELGATEVDGHLRFWVQDNGPGLDEEQQARLFTEFTRLHHVRAEGHGLGLSIVQRIVEKLGGEVGVESQPGAGSRFWFTLPRP